MYVTTLSFGCAFPLGYTVSNYPQDTPSFHGSKPYVSPARYNFNVERLSFGLRCAVPHVRYGLRLRAILTASYAFIIVTKFLVLQDGLY